MYCPMLSNIDLSRRRCLRLATALAATAALPAFGAPVALHALRRSDTPASLRLTFEFKGAVSPHVFILESPRRLVLDLPGAHLDSVRQALEQHDQFNKSAFVSHVRVGQFSPTVVRLVFALRRPVAFDAFSLTPDDGRGHRVVLDVSEAALELPRKAQALAGKPLVIAIDAGHGGVDPGAVGGAGTLEKEVVLRLAHQLAERLGASGRFTPVLTRRTDVFIPLRRRVDIAREARADMFISLHADAWKRRSARGSSVFTLSEQGATSVMANLLASEQNLADRYGDIAISDAPYLNRTLLDLSQTGTNHNSLQLANALLGELDRVHVLHKPAVERAGFAVLKAPDVPSVLVETAFISNPEEERLLRSSRFQETLVDALHQGVTRYAGALG